MCSASPMKSYDASFGNYQITATHNLVLILSGGLGIAFVCGIATCNSASSCDSGGTCILSEESICGFSNRVGAVTDAQYDTTASTETLSSLLTGICSPGDRTQSNPQTGVAECVPFYHFPSAINTEIMDTKRSTPSERFCGKWIDAGGPPMFITSVTHRGWSDNAEWGSNLLHAEDMATRGSRTATSSMSKFRAECERTTFSGTAAVRTSASMAYEYLKSYIDTNAVDRNGFLRSIGYEMSHRCASTVSAGSYLETGHPPGYRLYLASGYYFSDTTLSNALQVFGEEASLQSDADEANSAIRNSYLHTSNQQPTIQDLYEIIKGATGLTNLSLRLDLANNRLLKAALDYYDSSPSKAIAYLKGIAAFCSYNVYSSFFESTPSYAESIESDLRRIRSSSRPASALGRLSDLDEKVDAIYDASNATSITLAHVLGTGSAEGSSGDCLKVMRSVFADDVEAARFDATVTREFYDRLEPLVLSLRVGIGVAAHSDPIKGVLNNASEFSYKTRTGGFRIVGAPRGSWAGIARSLPHAEITSSDGMFVMILKQAKVSFMDEVVEVGISGTVGPCDHAPYGSSLQWQAYMIPALDCSQMFLGMLHRPMADPHYDDATLMSRALHVVGHELSHASISVGWDNTNISKFLKHYHPDTYSEAIADTISAVAILYTGLVNRNDFLTLFCQVWCSREPYGWTHPSTRPPTVHPSGNSRCDNLVATLDEFYPSLGS